MTTKEVNNIQKDKLLLTESDPKFVADQLQITRQSVDLIKQGKRGKRKSSNQARVKKALQFRSKQNVAFVQYCNQLKIDVVAPR